MAEIICVGDILMDMLPDREGADWEKISSFKPVPGGSVANVAIGLARLGVQTAFVGKVGRDPFGHLLARCLEDNRVEASHLQWDAQARTTLAFVSVPQKGENDFVFYRNPGADMMLSPQEINADCVAGARILHFGSISITEEPAQTAVMRAALLARAHGALVSFDPNLRPRLWRSLEQAKKGITACLKHTDIAKMNQEELEFLTGKSDPLSGARALLQKGPQVVLVTRGEHESLLATAALSCQLPGARVNVVDTVGCGDAFMAGALCQLLRLTEGGQMLASIDTTQAKTVLQFANVVGALTATGAGAIQSLPTREQVETYMRSARKA